MLLGEELPGLVPSSRLSISPQSECSSPSLSVQLREETADLHREVERKLGLPGTITTLDQYKRLLERFYRLYRPVELNFTHFSDWTHIGIDRSECAHSLRLAADLEALGILPLDLQDAPELSQPILVNFAQALGVMYVVEGSTLGSQVILPHLVDVLGKQILNADSFFRGRGARTGAFWSAFRTSLDRYSCEHPDKKAEVVSGARSAFEAIGTWMQA